MTEVYLLWQDGSVLGVYDSHFRAFSVAHDLMSTIHGDLQWRETRRGCWTAHARDHELTTLRLYIDTRSIQR